MAIITCAECGNHLSSNAAACPHCGNPVGTRIETHGSKTQLIEKTAKRFKSLQMFSVLLMIAGVIVVGIIIVQSNAAAASQAGAPASPMLAVFGILSLLLGLVLFVAARILAWWHHG